MVVYEEREIRGHMFLVARSDAGFKIERDGRRFDEAANPVGSERSYTETNEPILSEATEEDKDAALRRFGVEV